MSNPKTAIIIGAGPAGLTAAYELLDKTDIKPMVYEMTGDIGGISKTVNYKGNRIDIGGHRFFSKVDRVVDWWKNILPLQGEPSMDDIQLNRDIPLNKNAFLRDIGEVKPHPVNPPDPEKEDRVMLYRGRLSRIYFLRKLFNYPIAINVQTILYLGPVRLIKIFFSYMRVKIQPIKEEKSLEDFFINRFGRELYKTFFKDYTEKVWGVPCSQIKPEWGAQRIKGLSISRAIWHALCSLSRKDSSLSQKNVETTLIGQFMYPKFGPGQMWEQTARLIKEKGADIHMHRKVIGLTSNGRQITGVTFEDTQTGQTETVTGDYIFSTMPMKDLVNGLSGDVPAGIRDIANGLMYRDFMTCGILVDKLKFKNDRVEAGMNGIVPDNWMYIQEPDVKLCRLQIFNNWSPYMVKDPSKLWIGLEYMCQEGDDLWTMEDKAFSDFAADELAKINIIERNDVRDSVVIRMPKAYPAYFGTYDRFDEVKKYISQFENLFCIGRNGMHRYNNQDHSMLTAMVAVDNIVNGITTKDNIWTVNTEKEYHEEKKRV